jgi:hypothetical protein
MIFGAMSLLAVVVLTASIGWAGSPHFVSVEVVSVSGNSITVDGKEAGLGDESQIHVVLTANAECINNGANHPKAANKASASAEGDFPVQNGRANFTLTATVTFQPDCSPPMSVVFTSVVVCDDTNLDTAGCVTLTGPF